MFVVIRIDAMLSFIWREVCVRAQCSLLGRTHLYDAGTPALRHRNKTQA